MRDPNRQIDMLIRRADRWQRRAIAAEAVMATLLIQLEQTQNRVKTAIKDLQG